MLVGDRSKQKYIPLSLVETVKNAHQSRPAVLRLSFIAVPLLQERHVVHDTVSRRFVELHRLVQFCIVRTINIDACLHGEKMVTFPRRKIICTPDCEQDLLQQCLFLLSYS